MNDTIDEFESIFRRADKQVLSFVDIPISNLAFVTDSSPADSEAALQTVQPLLSRLESVDNWRIIAGERYHTVAELLAEIDNQRTDLIVTYRHLQERSFIPQHSLGVYLDVLTQTTSIPVLVLPGTAAQPVSVSGAL
ncbi:MAG: hypothetical protein R3C19_18695 [Planctomycetaceae bacterium]